VLAGAVVAAIDSVIDRTRGRGRITGIFTGNRTLTGLLPAVDLLGVDTDAAALRTGLSSGTSVRAPDTSTATRRVGASLPPERSYRPIARWCGRSTGCSAGASCTTANSVKAPLASVRNWQRSVLGPAVSSQARDQAARSRPELAATAAMRSAKRALA
jgi:hypothetical protein